MSETSDPNKQNEQPQEERKTRRTFITWAGQFAAGASLAALGLGLGMEPPMRNPNVCRVVAALLIVVSELRQPAVLILPTS